MSINLTHEESEAIGALRNAGMSPAEATLAVIMFTRGHARPEEELINIVDLYPGLADRQQTQQAIDALKSKGWLITATSYGQIITRAAPDLQQKMAECIPNQILIDRLPQPRSQIASELPPQIHLIGQMNSENNYGTYLDLLRQANSEICLPMLVTPPYPTTAAILQDRARRGVHVKLLLASPRVAAKIRGETVADRARRAISDWREKARGFPNMEIRMAHLPEDMYFATSWTLDRKLLRLDIYDPFRQRSLAGYMIEFDSRLGPDYNIVTLFQAHFDRAWNRAQPLHPLGNGWWWVKQNWQWVAFAITALIALPLGMSVWGGIVGSVAATFLFNALVTSWPMIRAAIRRSLGD